MLGTFSLMDFSVFSDLDYKLLHLLADGRFHSGRSLGESFGISRAAIWQHIHTLQAMGFAVNAVPGRGYRLSSPLDLLSHNELLGQIGSVAGGLLGQLEIIPVISSTNTYLREHPPADSLVKVCLAEYQSGGRGRAGRSWVSPFASNLYLSLAWRFEHGTARLGGLSLAVSVAVVRAITELGVTEVGIKWPNDIYVAGKKLAGILIEASGEVEGPCELVIGLGINVKMPDESSALIDQPWTDITRCGIRVGRNVIAARLLEHLLIMTRDFTEFGFGYYRDEWQRHDLSLNQPVTLREFGRTIEGLARGIDQQGQLLLEHGGTINAYPSGDVSLRLTQG